MLNSWINEQLFVISSAIYLYASRDELMPLF